MNGDSTRSPSPSAPGRTIDIELGQHEVITVELDKLDTDPADLIDLLTEGQCKVSIWTRLAVEYWRKGMLDGAEKIARAGKECMCLLSFQTYLQFPTTLCNRCSA